MSIALGRGISTDSYTIQRPQVIHGLPCHRSPASGVLAEDLGFPIRTVEERDEDTDSCSSSSIGRNSDVSSESSSDDEDSGEVQSEFKGGPLDTMDVLEEVLPIRRGISKHYNGKSKSFTSLSDAASSSSIKDIVKPVKNGLNKKRKIQNHHPQKTNRSALSLSGTNESNMKNSSSSPPCFLPPLHPQMKKSPINGASSPNLPWRSFSMADLHCLAPENPKFSELVISETNHC